jgi:glycosyltransferase involved in cell wall biosynthesis
VNAPGTAGADGRAGGDRPRLVHLTTTDISLELLLGPQLEAFAAAGYEVLGVSAPGPFVEALRARGIRHVPLAHATRAVAPHRDLAALGELWRLFRRLRPEVVHTHNPKPGVYGRLAARAAGVPVVVNTVHGLYATPEDRWARRAAVYTLERLAATCSDAELVQNPEDLATLRRVLRVPAAKLVLLGNGVDLDRFGRRAHPERWAARRARVRAGWGLDDRAVVVGAVGRLVLEKGYAELFAAWDQIRAAHPDAVLVVAGPVDADKADAVPADLLARAEAAGVRLLGLRDDVEDLYCAMDLYVLASHREGFPRSAMEAAASGLPIVATDIRGCRQVVDDGVTGLLVPVRDAAALAAAVGRLVADGDLRRRMGDAAAARAEAEFDQRRVIDVTLRTYERLLVARARRPPRRTSP